MLLDFKWNHIGIVGSGSFGLALANLIAGKGVSVTLLTRDAEGARVLSEKRCHPHYLPGVQLAKEVIVSADPLALQGCQIIFLVVPTSALREVCLRLRSYNLAAEAVLVSCAKGIERGTGKRMSEIIGEVLCGHPVLALSGPNHAEEIAHQLATCAVIAGEEVALLENVQQLLNTAYFRVYTSQDIAGVELGGALKNIYAIATGVAKGLHLGDNAIAALLTRALAEMTRLGTALNGKAETFAGLSGVGDLIATCFSEHSRNYRVGLALGKNQCLEEIVESLGMVAEGVPNTLSIYELAQSKAVRTPIIDAVFQILYEDKSAAEAMQELLSRDLRPERDEH